MTLPCQPVVRLRLGPGASFGNVLILGDQLNGILGTNILGTTTAQIVDITDEVDQISIRRGRDRIFESYTPGTATISWWDPNGDWNPDYAAGPYYGQILPMRQVMIQTTYNGTEYSCSPVTSSRGTGTGPKALNTPRSPSKRPTASASSPSPTSTP